ncbi:F-box protein At4g00755 [Elaeis guineensis]|uniref:F-box protein At4g00755 n=1 Tax=Elaeis guineensis var. tenera TaxID=51953 RepID=A0A6I9R2B3_ELAGV|nr:F-box protein At4g00755 [Elaeis guineensis]XP_010919234.1 F-box protein At4g00755 [Elaeis guineensis]
MENCWDLLEWLGPDTSTTVFMFLDDPADIVRASAVSRSWRRFVIVSGFSKNLCLRICPEASNFTRITEVSSSQKAVKVGPSTAVEWESLEREHKVYTYLSYCLVSPKGKRNCSIEAISASSTDNYPDESILNTLEPREEVDARPSYWSSGGEADPGVPETLTYRLVSKLCIIDEIKVQPFQAFFQLDDPIYSAKSVRFRMGHSRLSQGTGTSVTEGYANSHGAANDNYNWTYVSPEFPMVQENVLQSFKLPRPVICIGGIVQIELLGRVQRQATDNLYYICVCHVQVIGRPLSPVLDVDVSEAVGHSVLKYFPDASAVENQARDFPLHAFAARIRHLGAWSGWNQEILNVLLRPVTVSDDEDGSDEDRFE